MRSFTVNDGLNKEVYKGIGDSPNQYGHLAPFIAIVLFTGEPDLWSLDCEDDNENVPSQFAVSELKRYYWEQYGISVKVNVYSDVGEF